ncbi:MAG TPA: kynureninase [Sphingomicrobium sp.]|nr:kynureninase [Sphingomicrobium sp.]
MTLEEARALDLAEPLRDARDRFRLPPDTIYLDGNSLGALAAATPGRLAELVERQWGDDLIASWNRHGWIDAPARVAAKLAPLLGARPDELLIADSTSVSLFKLLVAAVRARPGRSTILSARDNFPTDLYVAQGVADLLPGIRLATVPADAIESAIDADTAVVLITHVDYRSAARFDIARVNSAAHAHGALTLWDLSHSAGALELHLDSDQCDLAVGCGYKYLNGGPGAPAFLFVAGRLQAELRSPLPGWMGHAEPFAFEPEHRPAEGIARFLTGTPSIVALAALDSGLDSFAGIAMADVEAKSRALSQAFIAEVEARCGGEVTLASPSDPAARGSHVSFAHPNAYAVVQALIERRVIGDFRAPNLMRFGFAPLYNRFADVLRAAEILADILRRRAWDEERFRTRARVT